MALESLEYNIDQLVRTSDDTFMALPEFELEPHLLISKVRKHYMEYVIKLLSINYETNQKLLNKNIYLPSAIWRCAKNIEMNAAQACMVVQLYRKNIISMVNELKNDTEKGRLNRKLYECLSKPPLNDKKTQTQSIISENKCQCAIIKRKRRHINSISSRHGSTHPGDIPINAANNCVTYNNIPAVSATTMQYSVTPKVQIQLPTNITDQTIKSPHPEHSASIDPDADDIMKQFEKLFQSDPNDEDIFEDTLFDRLNNTIDSDKNVNSITVEADKFNTVTDSVIENHAAQIKSLDERLASLTGLLVNNESILNQKTGEQKSKKRGSSKWLCEEYYLKQKLYELLDQIGDNDRRNLEKIKAKFLYYFGHDSDDEGVLSPLDETPEFVVSCKERIAPWVVKILTPYYIKGHIKGKSIFKSLAKHLIRLIYQCSRYPEEYEVTSFVADFLKNHKTIRCEADFQEFRIENI